MRNEKQKLTSFGGLPLTAVLLPAILLALAFVLYTAGAPATVAQIRAATNHLALAGMRGYSTSVCEESLSADECHNFKVQESLVSVQALMKRNESLFGSSKISTEAGSELLLEPLRYYEVDPPDGAADPGCSTYPCLVSPAADELANAIRVTGTVTDASLIKFFTRVFGINQPIVANVKSVAHMVALHVAMTLDTSQSLSRDSHVPPAEENFFNPGTSPTPPPDAETPVPPTPVPSPGPTRYMESGRTFENYVPDGHLDPEVWHSIAKEAAADRKLENGIREYLSDPSTPTPTPSPGYTSSDTVPSFFAWTVGENLPGSLTTLFQRYWDDMPESLKENALDLYPTYPNPLAHAQDDFTYEVKTYGPSYAAWSSYPDKQFHPDPSSADNPNIFLPTSGGDQLYYYIDGHEQPGKSGPEPYRSAMSAGLELLKQLTARQVPEDRFALIFYSHYLPWTSVIQINNDLTYPKTLMESMISGPGGNFPALEPRRLALGGMPISDYATDYTNTPPFYQLGLFPKAGHYTNPMLAYIQAMHEFNSVPGDVSAVRAIIDISDSKLNCVQYNGSAGAPKWGFPRCQDLEPTGPPYPEHCFFYFGDFACRDNFYGFFYGSDALDDFVRNVIFASGISLNIAQLPGEGGPHYLLKPSPSKEKEALLSGNPVPCMDDAEARSIGAEFVKGVPFNFDEEGYSRLGEGTYNFSHVVPFWQAAYDAYQRTVMTGGIYAPLMDPISDIGGTCGAKPDCSAAAGERMAHDWQCRTIEQQLVDAFSNVISNSQSYSLLDPDMDSNTVSSP